MPEFPAKGPDPLCHSVSLNLPSHENVFHLTTPTSDRHAQGIRTKKKLLLFPLASTVIYVTF
jgi:hypothetical protein